MRVKNEVELLQASIDEHDESHFRFLVDKKFVKYVTIDAGLYSVEDICFAPALIPLLPAFPPSDWNDGHLAKDPETSKPVFSRAVRQQFPGVKSTWHDTFVDHLELKSGRKLRSNVYEVSSPRFPSTVVAKFALFSWEIPHLEAETAAYQWIDGRGIGPRFLGHLTEEGRVIGFLIERIAESRHAGPADLSACQEALSRLHRLGVRHGDVNKHNFLIHEGRATMIDFDCARQFDNQEPLRMEFESLPARLMDNSGRGGCEVISNSS